MNAAQANARAETLRLKALALYAEAKALKASPTSFRESEREALIAKLDEAKAADEKYNIAVFRAMRLETEERQRKSRAA